MPRSVPPPDPEDLTAEWGRYGVSEGQLADLAAAGTSPSILGDLADAGPDDDIVYFGQNDDPITAASFFANQGDDYAFDALDPATGLSRGYGYTNNSTAPITSTVSDDPAAITVVPTSTTNPNRPRTVAAGYNGDRRTLTTVFRDGTYYNYYGVSQTEWRGFKRYRSKGEFIRLFLDTKRRGVADVGALGVSTQDLIYRTARTNQVMREGANKKPTKVGGGAPSYDVRKRQKQFQKRVVLASGRVKTVTAKTPNWQGAPSAFYARYGTRHR